MKKYRIMLFPLFMLMIVLSSYNYALANGGRGKRVIYQGELKVDKNQVHEFSTEIEEVNFLITSVDGKYRALRIRIRNWSRKKLALSVEGDAVLIHMNAGEQPVKGILDLYKNDKKTWNKFSEDLKSKLLYPTKVDPGEEENVFVFIPVNDIKSLPTYIEYSLKDQKKVEMTVRNLAKR
jgi:hypothetical protein